MISRWTDYGLVRLKRDEGRMDKKTSRRYDEVLDVVDVSRGLVLVCETGNSRLNSRASLVVRDTGEELKETFVYYSSDVYPSKDEMLKTIMDRYGVAV